MKVVPSSQGGSMKLKKRLEFKPKKVNSKHSKVRDDHYEEKKAEKNPKGARFGNRWFPYNKHD